jgi:hypothetical protein
VRRWCSIAWRTAGAAVPCTREVRQAVRYGCCDFIGAGKGEAEGGD